MVATVSARENQQPKKAMSLLDEALEGKNPEFQLKVLRWVYKTGVREDDVLFLVMVAIGQLQLILEESPKELNLLFEQWSEMLYDKLKDTEKVAVKSQQKAISQAVNELLAQTEGKQTRRIFSSILPAAGLLTVAISIGILLGMTVPPWLEGGYLPGKPRQLTVTEAEVLHWGMSKEGKLARNIMGWNAGILDSLECLKDVDKLNVTLEVQGRASKSGFCVLWVVPPQERQFEN